MYLALDYSDPSIPGVFFFDAEGFYLEGVVESRADAVPATPAPSPSATPFGVDRSLERERPASRLIVVASPTPLTFHARAPRHGAPPPSDARSEDH